MQVFKLYIKLLKNSWVSIAIYAFIFTALIIILSRFQGNEITDFKQSKVKTALVNYDKDSPIVQDFIEYLKEFCDFKDLGRDEMKITDALFFRDVEYVLTIPYNFGEEYLMGKEVAVEKKSVPDSIYTTAVDAAVNNYLNTGRSYLKAVPGITEEQLMSYIREDVNVKTEVTIDKSTKDTKSYEFANYYFNYASYVLLSCCLLGIGMVMVTFHNIDILRRNTVAPISIKNMNAQLIVGNIIFVLAFDLLFIILSVILNNDKGITENVLLYWLNLIIFSISAMAISYLIAMLIKSRQAAQAISSVLPLGLSFLSGAFVPQFLMGDFVLKLASFTPVYWFIRGNDSIAKLNGSNHENINNIFIYMLIQIGFAAALFALSLVVSKKKSQRNN
ncbi:ABC transporter permease [Anaerocolumna sp.]|uniref:ABC transporter permease n=1 Tax=Anaerocolumna sp. TaxID=2041569 RepID=UPI0028A7FD48|nr:ABC transporter permease [Anaerocolumna sp.]